MMQMMQIAFLASPPLKNQLQHNLKILPRTLLPQHMPSLRVPFSGHPPKAPT